MIDDSPTDEPASVAAAVHGPVHDNEVARGRALLIARLLIGAYLAYVLLDLIRPRVLPDEPTLMIFSQQPELSGALGRMLSMPQSVFWAILAGIVAGVVLQALSVNPGFSKGHRGTVVTWVTLAVMLGPFTLIPLTIIGSFPLTALACIPSSALVLLLLHYCQRFARLPVPMLLVAFGWGALMVFGLSRAYNGMVFGTINGYVTKGSSGADLGALVETPYQVLKFLALHTSVLIELSTAAGVLLLLVLFRHRVTDAMTGLVLGAAVGLGYNFTESIGFIQFFDLLSPIIGATGGFEYWIRQSIGLLGGHVTFGALLGAGLGLAAQARRRRQRTLIAGAGLVTAIGGAVATETLSAWFSKLTGDHLQSGGPLDTLVISPFLWLVAQVPFIVLALLLLRNGLRTRAAAARAAVSAEAVAGAAITEREVPFLVDPALQLWAVVSTWRRYGRDAALALRRLQSAQLGLAAWRWQQHAGLGADPVSEEGEKLRAKVILLKMKADAVLRVTP